MKEKIFKCELLSPAGSFDSCRAAVNAGADAVYMGGRKFGARAYAESANDTETDEVMEALRYCHLFSVRLYLTVNILLKNSEAEELTAYLLPYYLEGLDGVIVQDLGAIEIIKKSFPGLEIHASTQMTVCSRYSAEMLLNMGIRRAVLSRELSLKEIEKISATGIETEAFCHGAVCYSYSGECFMSSFLGGRSGNRGRCAGPCRLSYNDQTILSLKDMETLDFLPEMLKSGVYSFKIEGRMKSPIYTAGVTSIYRKYLDMASSGISYRVDERDRKTLRDLFDRGFSNAYLTKHNSSDMIFFGTAHITEKSEKLFDKDRKIGISMKAVLKKNSCPSLEIGLFPSKEQRTVYESRYIIEEARGRAITEEDIKRLSKTGGTVFQVTELSYEMDEGIFIPVGELNALRRNALEKFENLILDMYRRQNVL